MKKLSFILGILVFIDIIYKSVISRGQAITLYLTPNKPLLTLNTEILLPLFALLGSLGLFLLLWPYIAGLQEKLKKQTRNIEKASVEVEGASDKVKSLQSKIDTLEMALKEALKK